jgi:uncharacterized protein
MQVDFPFHYDTQGCTAGTSDEDHIHDLIEQVLFTSPCERVNRPDFGCGLMQLVFEPNSGELATTTQSLVQGALQKWLGELILVEMVDVKSLDSALEVKVQYTIRRTQERCVTQINRSI